MTNLLRLGTHTKAGLGLHTGGSVEPPRYSSIQFKVCLCSRKGRARTVAFAVLVAVASQLLLNSIQESF